MQTTEHSKETVQEALRLLAAHRGNVSKVSRQMGIARSVITSWRDGTRRGTDAGTAVAVAGVTAPARGDVSQDPGVTRAARLVQKWDRSTNKSLDIVNRRLDQLDAKLKKGGTVNTEDVRGLKDAAWVAGVGTDKISVLSGGVTSRVGVEFAPIRLAGDPRIPVRDMSTIKGEWREVGGAWHAEVDGQTYVYVAPGALAVPNALSYMSVLAMAGKGRSATDDAIDTTGSVVEEPQTAA